MLVCEKIAIDPEETSGQLFDRVAALGARVLCDTVPRIAAGTVTPVPQDHAAATLAPAPLQRDGRVPLDRHGGPHPQLGPGDEPLALGWFVTSAGRKVKVTESRTAESDGQAPGTVIALKPLTVACADGAVQLLRVVPEGSKPMEGSAFAAGLRLKAGDTL